MGLTTTQDLKKRDEDTTERKWSIKKLFPTSVVSSVISKTFLNVFDVMLGISVVTTAASELIHGDVSPWFMTITIAVMIAAFKTRENENLLNNENKNAST